MKRGVILVAVGHMATDITQGAIPALLPFLMVRHCLSYSAAGAIVFAANIFSSLLQPMFGYFADRLSMAWLMPCAVLISGTGIAFVGIAPGYWFILAFVALGGVGAAAFHPEAAHLINRMSGTNKATAMSLFNTGGQIGFAVGPLLVTATVLACGLKGTLLLIIPVTVTAFLLARTTTHFVKFESRTDGGVHMREDS